MDSTRRVPSEAWLRDHLEPLEGWARERWAQRADDSARNPTWRRNGNRLTADLTPGFLIQAPATLTYVPELHRRAVVELKIEVMWGRATVAFLVIDDHNGNPNKRFSKIYRGAHGEGAERPYNASDPVHAFHEGFEFGSLHWIFTEGHMPCAWALAERVAHAMAADQVRVDVFVAESRPTQCLVNEISLSSGNPSGTADRHWLPSGSSQS